MRGSSDPRWLTKVVASVEPRRRPSCVPAVDARRRGAFDDDGTAPSGGGSWQVVQDDVYFFQSEGRFAVRGTPPPGRLRLTFGADAAPVGFGCGTLDLVVEALPRRR